MTAPVPSLEVRFVRNLAEGLGDAIGFLESTVSSRPESIFDQATVVVPSVGVREWLTEQVALRLGATNGRDGVAANISFRFPGVLDHFMPGRPEDDPWSVPAMTAALLRLCGGGTWGEHLASRISSAGGPLRFAHKMADRFDRYHARRPAMIRLWEKGAWSLAPVADGPDDGMSAVLSDHDRWQFDLWRELRADIGVPSLPSRLEVELADPSPTVRSALPPRLLVFGFSSLGQHQIEVLRAIARYSAVTVVFVHPSPLLAEAWASTPSPPGNADALPLRTVPSVPTGLESIVLPLSFGWLRATRETQLLLGRTGVECVPHRPVAPRRARNLLEALQAAVRDGIQDVPVLPRPDESMRLHRCHGPARQSEVVHDAVVQALQDDPTLQLHEIAVMSPDIERMAPYLRATFGRTYHDSRGVNCAIPLVVADRALQRVDDGARVFVEFLRVAGSRLDVATVRMLLGDPSLLASHGVEEPDRWWQWISSAEQRWGADAAHRAREGVEIVADDGRPEHRHTWLHTARRIILGAVASPDDGAVVTGMHPLPDVDADELPSVLKLTELITALVALVDAGSEERSPARWAAAIEDAFTDLCGDDSPLLAVPLDELSRLAALGDDVDVSFSDVAAYLTARFEGVPDARLTRFGGVLATSMASQRLVPYRVICLVGVDDEALGAGESEGDDLIGRQQLAGDPDPRAEHRRAILDAVMSASDRIVICCNGQSLKNNDPVPTPVPISELMDACRIVGAPERSEGHSALELDVAHPRHALSTRNFQPDGVIVDRVWSHAADSRDLAAAIASGGATRSAPRWNGGPGDTVPRLSTHDLAAAIVSPLSVFLENALKVSRSARKDPATRSLPDEIPLDLDGGRRSAAARRIYLERDEEERDAVTRAIRTEELLPVTTGAGARALADVKAWVAAATAALPRESWTTIEGARTVEVALGGGTIVTADVPMEIELAQDLEIRRTKTSRTCEPAGTTWHFDPTFDGDVPSNWEVVRRFITLLVATAEGRPVDGAMAMSGYTSERSGSSTGTVPMLHQYRFRSDVTQETARRWLSALVELHGIVARAPIPSFNGLALEWARQVVAVEPTPGERERLSVEIALQQPEPRRPGKALSSIRMDDREQELIFGSPPDIESIELAATSIVEHGDVLARWWGDISAPDGGNSKVSGRPYVRLGMDLPAGCVDGDAS